MKRLNIVLSIGLLVSATPIVMYAAAADENPAKRAKIASDEESIKQNGLNKGLLKAAQAGEIDTVNQLLGQGAEVNARNDRGWTALMFAASNGHTEMAKILIENKADVNVRSVMGFTALMLGAHGHTEVAKLLLANKANVNAQDTGGWTALKWATAGGHAEVAASIIANTDENPIENIKKTQEDLNRELLSAAETGNIAAVRELIKQGAEVNAQRC